MFCRILNSPEEPITSTGHSSKMANFTGKIEDVFFVNVFLEIISGFGKKIEYLQC